MHRRDPLDAGQIRDRAGDAKRPMNASRGHSAAIDRITDESSRLPVERAYRLERGVRQCGVERSSLALRGSCGEHALAHDCARFSRWGGKKITRGQRGHFDLEIEAVEDRP